MSVEGDFSDSLSKQIPADDAKVIADLRKLRGSLKGRLTLFDKYVSKLQSGTLSEVEITEIRIKIQLAKDCFENYSNVQNKIEVLVPETELEQQLEYREIVEDQFHKSLATAQCIVNINENAKSNCPHSSQVASVKLPEIRLPTFDGSYDQWLEFRNSYLTMIHERTDLNSIQKLHYLKSSLRGCALQVISALEFTASNYTVAWELLENRFHNSRLLVHNHVRSLFTADTVSKESPLQIRQLIDTTLRNMRALQTLGEPTESWDTLIIYLLLTKVTTAIEREWEAHKASISNTHDSKLKLEDLLSFLRNKADMLEVTLINKPKFVQNASHSTDRKPTVYNHSRQLNSTNNFQPTNSYVSARANPTSTKVNDNNRILVCILCKGNHKLFTCPSFLNLSVSDRINFVNEKMICRNCLRTGHLINECLFGPCKQCQLKHNSLLHTSAKTAGDTHRTSPVDNTQESLTALHTYLTDPNSNKINTTASPAQQVLLCTALVDVFDENNKRFTARALLDNGSQHCFISEKLFKLLNVSFIQSTMQISGVGQSLTQSNRQCEILIRSKIRDFNATVRCMVLPCITSNLPSTNIDFKSLHIPENFKLADPSFFKSSAIDLLIGADYFWEFLDSDRIRLPSGPYLQSSKLGWLISGMILSEPQSRSNKQSQCHFTQSIDNQLKQFWELEEVSNNKKVLTRDDLECEKIFKETTTRDPDTGRFSVRIPMRASADSLGKSYNLAKTRFLALERKFKRLEHYKKLYSEFIHEYIDMGHMSKIESYDTPNYFLPHHGVYREHSSTTKMRVVFDASAATTSGKSLNDIQYTGPILQNDIFSILLRFRQYKYVACADVEKMFRQILVQVDQRHLQLILWRDHPSESLGVYQLNTVTYGTCSAPYLSMRCIKELAKHCDDLEIAKIIDEDFYVDDLITGTDNPQHLVNICEKISQILRSGGFSLRKWTFNHDVSSYDSKELSIGEHHQTKTLGLGWYNNSDELHYTTRVDPVPNLNKRQMLSAISQVYDPLGLLAPVTVIAKMLLQKLWLCKIGWDDEVSDNIKSEWEKFINTLRYLNNLRIPRFVMSDHTVIKELHIFSDASQYAYGACAYVRTYNICDSTPVIRLLCAKSKVSPIKTVTIPRLELCGALLGARLYKRIITSLRLKFDRVLFWTDSTIVMGWIRMSPHLLKTFVQNRVTEINELTGDSVWLHISGKDNPAALVSRGVYLDTLIDCRLWWGGPSFLHDKHTNFGVDHTSYVDAELPELKNETVCSLSHDTEPLIDFSRFSSFKRLKRTGAYVLRFIANTRAADKKDRKIGSLSVDELNASLTMLIRIAQRQSFPNVLNKLSKQLPFDGKCDSKRVSGLNVFLDVNGVIRVGGRLSNATEFNYDKKHPILLCNKNYFCKLLFRYEHLKQFHAGPQLLLYTIRECWWPLSGRNLSREIVHQCVICTRMKGKILTPVMGDLPNERLAPGNTFMRCGVADYAGPLMMLSRKGRGAKLVKCYICLFVCFITRAIHLELVSSLSTSDYLLALKRFISRRGKPIEIFSDNGKLFVGAQKELSQFLNDNCHKLVDYAANDGIKLTFIPPYAPHFGGLWEAGVKSCKHHLKRIMGNCNMIFEELTTVLTQIEAILNSRPMYPLSSNPNDLLPLTPGHFLIGRPLTAPPSYDVTTANTTCLTRYKRVEQMRQQFWQRWSREYISELQARTKWKAHQSGVVQRATSKICSLPPQPLDTGKGKTIES